MKNLYLAFIPFLVYYSGVDKGKYQSVNHRQYLMYHLDGNVLSDNHSYLHGLSKADQVLIGQAHLQRSSNAKKLLLNLDDCILMH